MIGAEGSASQAYGGLPGLPHFAARAKRVIYLLQAGAPSQMELLDYKPTLKKLHGSDLPASVRMGQRLTGMTAGQKKFPIVNPPFPFRQHGETGTWVSVRYPSNSFSYFPPGSSNATSTRLPVATGSKKPSNAFTRRLMENGASFGTTSNTPSRTSKPAAIGIGDTTSQNDAIVRSVGCPNTLAVAAVATAICMDCLSANRTSVSFIR